MAITLVNHGVRNVGAGSGGTGTGTWTLPWSLTAGNTLMVFIAFSSFSTGQSVSATDGINTYHLIAANTLPAPSDFCTAFYAVNVAAGSPTINTNPSQAGWNANWVYASEWSGLLPTTSVVDAHNIEVGSSASPLTINITTTNANDLIMACFSDFLGSDSGFSQNGSWLILDTTGASPINGVVYQIVSATGSPWVVAVNEAGTPGTTWGAIAAAMQAQLISIGQGYGSAVQDDCHWGGGGNR